MELKEIDEIPEDYQCSISGQIMFDPVVVVESGHSYERVSILTWFETHNTDPQSRTHLTSKAIIDNHTLRRIISQYLGKNPQLYEDEGAVYLPKQMKLDVINAVTKSDIQSFRDCIFKHPGLLYAPLNDQNQTLLDLVLEMNQQMFLEKFLLKLISLRGKQGLEKISKYQDRYVLFCRSLVMSTDQDANKALELLLSHLKQEDLDKADEKGFSMVHYAAMTGNLPKLQMLIDRGADPLRLVISRDDSEDENGLNPFMIVCAKGYLDIVTFHLSLSHKPNLSATTTYNGKDIKEVSAPYYFSANCTAAQMAAFNGHKAVLQRLIDCDSKVLSQTSKDEDEATLTLLDFAIIGEQYETVEFLLSLKAFTECEAFDKQKSFVRALQRCHKEILLLLWEFGFRPPEAKNMLHDTLKFLSYDIDSAREDEKKHKAQNFSNVFQSLIKCGADLEARIDGDHIIHIAARNGLTAIVIFLLKAGVKADIENEEGETILQIAVENDDEGSLFDELLRYSVNVHCVDSHGNTLLHLARRQETISALLSRGLDPNLLNHKKQTPLVHQLQKRRFSCAQFLVESNADLSPRDEDSKSALFYVCERSFLGGDDNLRAGCLRAMLARQLDLKVTDKEGNTPLHCGLDISIIRPIVEHLRGNLWPEAEIAAYLSAQNSAGDTVLMKVCQQSWSGSTTATFLVENGADPKLLNKAGEQAIHVLFGNLGHGDSLKCKLEFAEFLLKRGVDINAAISGDGNQPLHLAVIRNSEDAVRWLLDHGASKVGLCKVQKNLHKSAVELTLKHSRKSLLTAFLDSGYDVNYKNSRHSYALIHWAAHYNSKDDIFDLLLNRKANIELVDDWGFTPLLRAAINGSLLAFNYLINKGASITKVTLQKKNILHLIAEDGQLGLLEPLKSYNVTDLLEAKDDAGLTPICCAAKKKHLPILKSLVTDFKASLCVKKAEDDTVLKYAIDSGDDEICNYLLDQKSLSDDISNKLSELLFQAIQSGVSDSVCERIATLGVDFDAKSDDEEDSLLMAAAKNGKLKFMRFLMERGAKLNETIEENIYARSQINHRQRGRVVRKPIGKIYVTALYALIKDLEDDVNQDTELYKTIEQFVKRGADLTVSNSVECKCHLLAIAVEREALTLVKLLLSCGVDLKAIDKEWSLLQYPAQSGNLELAKLLVEHGAEFHSDNESNPIVVAAACGHRAFVEFFVSKWPTCVTFQGKCQPQSTGNYLKLVEEEVDEDDEIDVIKHSKISALHAAILEDHPDLIPLLIKSGVPVDIMCVNLTPIQLAVILNRRSSVSALLIHQPNLFVLKEASSTLLHLLVEYSDVETIKQFDNNVLLKWLEIADASGDKPLHFAVKENKEEIIRFLVGVRANVNTPGHKNKTALHHAVLLGRENLVTLLLENGADVRLLDSDGRCALHYANTRSIAHALLNHSDENQCVNLQDTQGNTPLHLSRSLEVSSLLLEHGADSSIENKKGENCLFTLISDSNRSKDRLKLAEEINAQTEESLVDSFDNSGRALIHVVCRNNDLEALEWLGDKDADVDLQTRDEEGETPLTIAAAGGFDKLIECLIRLGAGVDIPRKKHLLTPLTQSIWCGNYPNTVRLLLSHGADPGIDKEQAALFYTIFFSKVDLFRVFQDSNIDLFTTTPSGKTILHHIAACDSTGIFNCLTSEQISRLYLSDNGGNTPLHVALEGNKEKICGLLLSLGIRNAQTNKKGETILHAAIKGKVSTSLIDTVIKSGVVVNAQDIKGNTALMQCAINQDFVRLRQLIEAGCSVETTNRLGESALVLLCEHVNENTKDDSDLYSAIAFILKTGKSSVVDHKKCLRMVVAKNSIVVTQLFEKAGLKISEIDSELSLIAAKSSPEQIVNCSMLAYLIQQGANVKHADFPLAAAIGSYLRENSSFYIICMLIENDADVNQSLNEGGKTRSLLNALCNIGENDNKIAEERVYILVKFLLDKGADVNFLDESANSSLHLAAMCNFTKIVELLVDRGANPRLENNKGYTPMKAARKAGHDPNYIHTYIYEREQKQKKEFAELQAEVSNLRKQNEVLKSSFAVYRRTTEREFEKIAEHTKQYNPRFRHNIPSVTAMDEEVTSQQLEYK
ncbi:MAG: ankyrin repeat domain-containing protein [Gammaproteobacteria bacterium]|nr:ankyrin repeat domain-containing protein [Gammaproteobacteria bacterium]